MENSVKPEECVITGRVIDSLSKAPIRNAEVHLFEGEVPQKGRVRATPEEKRERLETVRTNTEGRFRFRPVLITERKYHVECSTFGRLNGQNVPPDCEVPSLEIPVQFKITTHMFKPGECEPKEPCDRGMVGRRLLARAESAVPPRHPVEVRWKDPLGASLIRLQDNEAEITFHRPGVIRIEATLIDKGAETQESGEERAQIHSFTDAVVSEAETQMIGGKVGVTLERTASPNTLDQALWVAIRNRTRAISFGPYREFIDRVLGAEEHESLGVAALDRKLKDLGTHMHGVVAYQLLKLATEVFLLLECGVRIESGRQERVRLFHGEEESERLGQHATLELVKARLHEYLGSPPQLPYITRVVETAFPFLDRDFRGRDRVLTARINEPCLIELIWSYWHEEGMLVQTMNAIGRRFQNVRGPEERNPLAHLELDPLRPLGNVLWGQIQDELNLLSVRRRAYEYSHEYGLTLFGKAAEAIRPADNRSKFLEAFHNLLHLSSVFFKEDNDTTVIADGYPLLNALKEVHLLLAQGAHNQFGDLPWTARSEMMLQEWILARPEIRDFLQSRAMVPYKEPWMPQVDTMKTLQGWSDVTVTHFRDLGVYGEQILLSIRYGDWIELTDEDHAKNWARYWRPEIQAYLHAYRAVTGIDLTNPDTVDATAPAIHLQRRLAIQQRAL
jgi:hypothetical protein